MNPARASYLDSKPIAFSAAKRVQSKEQAQLLQKLLSPLGNAISALTEGHSDRAHHHNSLATEAALCGSVPCLFEIAVRCIPAKRGRRRAEDVLWLESVFVLLIETVGISILDPNPADVSTFRMQTLRQLLHAALEKKTKLSTDVLQEIALRYTKLSSDDDALVDWQLCSLILRMDPDVFLASAQDKESLHHSQTDMSKCLFSRIFSVAAKEHLTNDHPGIQQQIFLSLMHEFSKARDLDGFLRRWHHGIAQTDALPSHPGHSTAVSRPDAISFVEDQRTFRELYKVLETSLTATQISHILDFALSFLTSTSNDGHDPVNGAVASVVLLDAVLGAVYQDETLESLYPAICSIYGIILIRIESGTLEERYHWRLWRILATIQGRWPDADPQLGPDNTREKQSSSMRLQRAIAKVSEIFQTYFDTGGRGRPISTFAKVSEVFHFILSLLGARQAASNTLEGRKALEALDTILVNLTRSLDTDLEQALQKLSSSSTIRWLGSRAEWSGSSEDLDNDRSLTIALLARLTVQFPDRLMYVVPSSKFEIQPPLLTTHRLASTSMRKSIFKWAFLSSKESSFTTENLMPLASFNSHQLWNCLLESERILNSRPIKGNLNRTRFFSDPGADHQAIDDVMETLLSGFEPGVGFDLSENSIRYRSVGSALKLSLDVFTRSQRELVIDTIVQEMVESAEKFASTDFSSHLSLAVKLMQVRNATARLVGCPGSWHRFLANVLQSTEPDLVWSLATQIPTDNGLHSEIISAAFGELVRLCLR